jgi:ATP-dependent DNA ligase
VRVIVRVGPTPEGSPAATVFDEDGADSTAEFAELAQAIASAADAAELVLDGYLTVEPTQITGTVGTDLVSTPTPSQVLQQFVVGIRRHQSDPRPQLDPERPIAFVAVDLLLIDGQSLIDLPLLERKRLLETALKANAVVRITPYVRSPVGSLAMTWHAQGFRELVYKPANGRYRAAGEPSDWVVVPIRPH